MTAGDHKMNVRGFTLIELMITVGIAAILLLVGVPSMSQRLAAEQASIRVARAKVRAKGEWR